MGCTSSTEVTHHHFPNAPKQLLEPIDEAGKNINMNTNSPDEKKIEKDKTDKTDKPNKHRRKISLENGGRKRAYSAPFSRQLESADQKTDQKIHSNDPSQMGDVEQYIQPHNRNDEHCSIMSSLRNYSKNHINPKLARLFSDRHVNFVLFEQFMNLWIEPMAVIDVMNTVIYANEALTTIFGSKQLTGQKIDNLFPLLKVDFTKAISATGIIFNHYFEVKDSDKKEIEMKYYEMSYARLDHRKENDACEYCVRITDITDKVISEKQRQKLLQLMNPNTLRFKKGTVTSREHHPSVSIGWLDIKGFSTKVCDPTYEEEEYKKHEAWVEEMDSLIDKMNITMIQYTGDGYILGYGLLEDEKNDPSILVKFMDRAINVSMMKFNYELRCSVHTGEIKTKFIHNHFICTHKTVIIAKRLEETCLPGYIHVSKAVIDLIENPSKYLIVKRLGQDIFVPYVIGPNPIVSVPVSVVSNAIVTNVNVPVPVSVVSNAIVTNVNVPGMLNGNATEPSTALQLKGVGPMETFFIAPVPDL